MSASITQFPSRHDAKLSGFLRELALFRRMHERAKARQAARMALVPAPADSMSQSEIDAHMAAYERVKLAGLLPAMEAESALVQQIKHGDPLFPSQEAV